MNDINKNMLMKLQFISDNESFLSSNLTTKISDNLNVAQAIKNIIESEGKLVDLEEYKKLNEIMVDKKCLYGSVINILETIKLFILRMPDNNSKQIVEKLDNYIELEYYVKSKTMKKII